MLAFGACIGTIAFIASYIQSAMGGDSDSDILSNAAMSSALEGENIMCNVCGNCPGCILDQGGTHADCFSNWSTPATPGFRHLHRQFHEGCTLERGA